MFDCSICLQLQLIRMDNRSRAARALTDAMGFRMCSPPKWTVWWVSQSTTCSELGLQYIVRPPWVFRFLSGLQRFWLVFHHLPIFHKSPQKIAQPGIERRCKGKMMLNHGIREDPYLRQTQVFLIHWKTNNNKSMLDQICLAAWGDYPLEEGQACSNSCRLKQLTMAEKPELSNWSGRNRSMETSQVSHPKYFGSEDCPRWPNAPWLKPPPGRRRDSGETRAAGKNKEDQRSPSSYSKISKNLKSSSPKNHFMHPVPSAIEKEPPIKPTRAQQGIDWRVDTRPFKALRWSRHIKTVPCLWINGA